MAARDLGIQTHREADAGWVDRYRVREARVSVGPSHAAVRWRNRQTGAELAAVVLKPAENGCMVLPVEKDRGQPHPLDWLGSEETFLGMYEAVQ